MRLPIRIVVPALLAAFAAADAPKFVATQRSYPTGLVASGKAYYPQGHVLADLDGDLDLDVAVAHIGNFIGPRFSVLKNRGDGSFEAPVYKAISGECADVVAADLDGDGDQDLAFCIGSYGTSGQSVAVFKNNGDATFAAQLTFACGRGPTGIAALDADRDGDFDLATANWYWNEADVSVLYNNGTGSFSTRVDFPIAGTQPYKVEAGDLNGDAWPDLAVSPASPTTTAVAVLLNNGAGAFGAPVALAPASGATVNSVPGVGIGDTDGDGDQDILYSQGGAVGSWGSIGMYRNQGNGTFGAIESFAVTVGNAHDFAVADLTLDGVPDVVCVGHSNKYGYSLLRGDGAGGFLPEQNFRAGEMSRSISIGDLDLDLDLEVVVADSGSNTVSVHDNEGGTFSMPYMVGAAAFCNGIASGDIDGDGDLDAVTTDNRIWSLYNDGAGHFSAGLQTATVGSLSHCKLRDVNGDGYVDLLAKSGGVFVALNEGAAFPGYFQPFVSLGSGNVNDFTVDDFDGDGDLDVAGTYYSSGGNRLVLVKNNGNGTFGGPSYFSASSIVGGGPIVSGDFDNDGDIDVVYGSGDAVAWLNSGSGSFGPPISTAAAGGFIRMAKGDFNGDGNLDVAGVNYEWQNGGENLVVSFGLGNGSFGAPSTYYGMFSLQYGGTTGVATIDVELDGDLDLLCCAYGGHDIVLFENSGSGTFGTPVGYGISGSTTALHVADVDGDGLADVLANVGTEPPIGGGVQVLFGTSGTPLPVAYCTAGTTSSGCAPSMSSSGTASASGASAFTLHANGVEGQRQGLIFYGVSGRAALPWGSGSSFLCVQPPTQRSGVQSTGGTDSACDGGLALDWQSFLAAYPGALGTPFQPGDVVDAQGWFRDPPAAKSTNLTNALEFTLAP